MHCLLGVQKFYRGKNRSLVFVTIHEQPLPLPRYFEIYVFQSISSAAQTNDSRRDVVWTTGWMSQKFTLKILQQLLRSPCALCGFDVLLMDHTTQYMPKLSFSLCCS
jgi:hypothetical protein